MIKSTFLNSSQDFTSIVKNFRSRSLPLVIGIKGNRIQDYFASIGVFQSIFIVLAIFISWISSIHGKEVAEWYALLTGVVTILTIFCSFQSAISVNSIKKRHKKMKYDLERDFKFLAKCQRLHFRSLHLTVCTILMGIAFVIILNFGGLTLSAIIASFFLGLVAFVSGSLKTSPKCNLSSIVLFVPQTFKFAIPNAFTPNFLSHSLLVQLSLNTAYTKKELCKEAIVFIESISDPRARWPRIQKLEGISIKNGFLQRIAGLWRYLPHTIWIVALTWLLSALTPPNLIPPISSPFSFLPSESNIENKDENSEQENSETQPNEDGNGGSQGNSGNSSSSGGNSNNGNTNSAGSNEDSFGNSGGSNGSSSDKSSNSQGAGEQSDNEAGGGGNNQEYQTSQADNVGTRTGNGNNSGNNNSGENGSESQSHSGFNEGRNAQSSGAGSRKGENGNSEGNGKANNNSGKQKATGKNGKSGNGDGNQPQDNGLNTDSDNTKSKSKTDRAEGSSEGNKSQQQTENASSSSNSNKSNSENLGGDPVDQTQNNESDNGGNESQSSGQSNSSGLSEDYESQSDGSNSENEGNNQQSGVDNSNDSNQKDSSGGIDSDANTEFIEDTSQLEDVELVNNLETYDSDFNSTDLDSGNEQLDFSVTEIKFPEEQKDQAELSTMAVKQNLHPMVQFVNSEINFSSCKFCSNLVLKSQTGESLGNLTGDNATFTDQKIFKGKGGSAKQRIPSWIHEITQQSE